MSEVQAFRFPKQAWTRHQAHTWLYKRKHHFIKVTESANEYRFRMQDPKRYKRFVTLEGASNGKPLNMIIGFKKKKN
jgi:hypothetical protein